MIKRKWTKGQTTIYKTLHGKEQMYTTFDISHHVGETLILQQNLSGIARIVFSSRRKSLIPQMIDRTQVYLTSHIDK
jgi:hypothetical protein